MSKMLRTLLAGQQHLPAIGNCPCSKAYVPGYLAIDFATDGHSLTGIQAAPALQDVDYEAIGRFAVRLTGALQEQEVFERASQLLHEKVVHVCAIQFTHVLNNEIQLVTFQGGSCKRRRLSQPLARNTAAAQALLLQGPVCEPDLDLGQAIWADWAQLRADRGAICMLTVPIVAKGAATGALTVACRKPRSLNRAAKELVDIVANLVAPYMHIKDVRRSLQVAQSLLLDSLPQQVVSHMLERQTMGMTPVLGAGGMLRYPRSDDDDGSSDEES